MAVAPPSTPNRDKRDDRDEISRANRVKNGFESHFLSFRRGGGVQFTKIIAHNEITCFL